MFWASIQRFFYELRSIGSKFVCLNGPDQACEQKPADPGHEMALGNFEVGKKMVLYGLNPAQKRKITNKTKKCFVLPAILGP